ncbi:Oxidoreductase [Klebsiella grimontii]|nr:Oxidoreductase [Klebsiella grimontii]
MQYHRIPHSSLEISTLGLGTMTFGEQNSEADAHEQLDYAVSQGINLIDVAEMYPVPPRPETQGLDGPTSATGWRSAAIAKSWLSPLKSAALPAITTAAFVLTTSWIAKTSAMRCTTA